MTLTTGHRPTTPTTPLLKSARRAGVLSGLKRKLGLAMSVSVVTLCTLHPVVAQDGAAAPATPAAPIPYTQSAPLPPQATDTIQNTAAQPYVSEGVSDTDGQLLEQALSAVKSHSFSQADSLAGQMSSPLARKIVTWSILSNDGDIYSFASLDAARRDLWGWPKEAKRQVAAEKLIGQSGMGPQQIVDWFTGSPPQTVDGATALIGAYQALNRTNDAQALAKQWWRTEVLDVTQQGNFFANYGKYLTQDDHIARLNCLLINSQNTTEAIRDMLTYVDDHQRTVANAVLAMRSGSASGDSLYNAALSGDPHNPALAFARARYLATRTLEPLGFPLLADLPPASASPDAAQQLYTLRLDYFRAALKAHDYHAAYNAMNGGGFDNGESKAESEFFAGWIALVKLNDPKTAITHFQTLATAGTSPITQGRAAYWLGRAYEARNDTAQGDAAAAQAAYARGGQYIYAFYGQLAAEKAGVKTITLGHDPVPSQADRDRFNNRDMVRAAIVLGNLGEMDLFRSIVLNLDTVLPNAEEEALLVDMTARYDSQIMAMKVARMSMQRGFYLPERAYPLHTLPDVPAPEQAFVLAIARQESGFDPSVRSYANARGIMQLEPSTARIVARRLGVPYSESRLYDADYNMTLGSYHLGELVNSFDGSYILAAAGYNAGPSRMTMWIGDCGEPRGTNADALSFIECMPLSQTRDYMMRVIENMRVYRARLNGGTAPLTAMADVTRGIPAPISPVLDSEDTGDGSVGGSPDQPMSYLDYQKALATQAASAQIITEVAKPAPRPVEKPEPVRRDRHGRIIKSKKTARDGGESHGKKGRGASRSETHGKSHKATPAKKHKRR